MAEPGDPIGRFQRALGSGDAQEQGEAAGVASRRAAHSPRPFFSTPRAFFSGAFSSRTKMFLN